MIVLRMNSKNYMKVENEMPINKEVIELTKQLVKAESELESVTMANESMKTYMTALIKENTMLKSRMAQIKCLAEVDNAS